MFNEYFAYLKLLFLIYQHWSASYHFKLNTQNPIFEIYFVNSISDKALQYYLNVLFHAKKSFCIQIISLFGLQL